jgi:thiamine-phosphate pyrophosphorylase
MNADLSVYLVTDTDLIARAGHDLTTVVRAATMHGVNEVQVRDKGASARELFDIVVRVAHAVEPHVAVIVNDRVDVFLAARNAGAPVGGVHVGQSDLPADTVRRLIGDTALLGLSAATPEELTNAAEVGAADYVGIGALHTTTTKRDAPPALGHDRFARLVEACALPSVAIGGVTTADLPQLRRAGAAGAAVVSAICSADDPSDAARELRAAWNAA